MTLRLILMRHAKSSWDDLTMSDHERPLNKRGRKAAKALGVWLQEQGFTPDQALCSTAERTRETLARSVIACSGAVETKFLDGLYHASAHRMLDVLQSHGTGQTVMLVSHNPGAGAFAEAIVQAPPKHAGFASFPSGATLVVEFDAENWKDVRFGSGALRAFIVPRELTD